MTKPAAVAVYARISSDQDGTALGVSRQVEDCRKLADQLGWTVAEEYIDNDVSAYSGKRRPAYDRMLDDLRDGRRDGVVVYHADRLTRRPIELEQFLDAMAAGKVRHVRFVSGADVDVGNGDGLLVLRMMAAVAANESDNKSRRIRRKMVEVAESGRPHGGSHRPFGYEPDRITVRPEEAAVIRDLVARFLAGESFRSLTIWLDDNDIQTVHGKPWKTSALRQMMASARIAGLRAHRGQTVGPAVWDPIISVEDHQRVRALMEQRSVTRTRTTRRYLLTGMLHCGRCDKRLYSSPRANSRRYVCNSGPDFGGCGRLTVTALPLEQLAVDAVLYRLDTPELAAALTGQAAADEQTAALSDAVAEDSEQLEELANLYAARDITAIEWKTARKAIEQRRDDNARRLSRITRNDALTGIVGNGTGLRTQWADLNLTRQAAIVRAVVDRIIITPIGSSGSRAFDPDRVDIVWRV